MKKLFNKNIGLITAAWILAVTFLWLKQFDSIIIAILEKLGMEF